MTQSFIEKLTQTQNITSERTLIIRKSYLLLAISILGMVIGGKVGINSKFILNLFNGFLGWILAMVALNAMPSIALKVEHNPNLATFALFGNGFIAGLVLSPMLYIAQYYTGGEVIFKAVIMTFIVFAVVTFLVYTNKNTWSPSANLVKGLIFTTLGGIVISFFIQTTFISLLITLGIGALGVISLIVSTSEVLKQQRSSSPVLNAVQLFSGVFMVFQSILYLFMMFGGNDD